MYHRPSTIIIDKSVRADEDYELPKHFYEFTEHENIGTRAPIWNPLTHEIYGRKALTLMKILLLYLILYVAVFITFTLVLGSSLTVLSYDTPKYTFSQPGLTFAPICRQLEDFPRIKYNEKYLPEVKCLVDNAEKFFSKYGHVRDFGDCTLKNNYGYVNRTPCIFLKFNRSIGFRLDPIEDASDLPSSAPDELRSHMNKLPAVDRTNKVWLSCQTNYDHIANYFPYRGIPAKVLELDKMKYENSEKLFQRIVAVQFDSIPVNKNVKIECHAWAKNIVRETGNPVGLGRGYLKLYIHIETP